MEEQADGTPRYFLLETLREYGRDQLEAAGELDALRNRHRAHCCAGGETAAEHRWDTTMLGWHERFNRELDNLRVAAGWCVARGQAGDDAATERGLVVLADLGLYWSFLDGRYGELRTWLQRLLALQGAVSRTRGRARALLQLAFVEANVGDLAVARQFAEESVAVCRELGDRQELADSLASLSGICLWPELTGSRPRIMPPRPGPSWPRPWSFGGRRLATPRTLALRATFVDWCACAKGTWDLPKTT